MTLAPDIESADAETQFQSLVSLSPPSFSITLVPVPLPSRQDQLRALKELDIHVKFSSDDSMLHDLDEDPHLSSVMDLFLKIQPKAKC